uniref:F-box associated domain-containing protein n=1 Tax=Aegilops tauschii subsp. strangulata TaxID=200361 RepID=A0A453N2Z8_AEGTS
MPPAAHARIQPHCPPRVRARRVAALPGLLIPRVPWRLPADGEYDDDDDNPSLESEWPPASYPIHVFSSVTQRWDETTFLREGEAAGIVANMVSYPWYDECRYYGVYWQRTLYIQTKNCYLTRMSLSDHTYSVIKLPGASELMGYPNNHHLGKSSRGVYCAILDVLNRLQVWYLSESCGRIEWVLKHHTRLKTFEYVDYAQQLGRQWILQKLCANQMP